MKIIIRIRGVSAFSYPIVSVSSKETDKKQSDNEKKTVSDTTETINTEKKPKRN